MQLGKRNQKPTEQVGAPAAPDPVERIDLVLPARMPGNITSRANLESQHGQWLEDFKQAIYDGDAQKMLTCRILMDLTQYFRISVLRREVDAEVMAHSPHIRCIGALIAELHRRFDEENESFRERNAASRSSGQGTLYPPEEPFKTIRLQISAMEASVAPISRFCVSAPAWAKNACLEAGDLDDGLARAEQTIRDITALQGAARQGWSDAQYFCKQHNLVLPDVANVTAEA